MQIDISSYVTSNEWELIASPGRKTVVKYPCCPEPYPDLTFVIVIQRIPIFYVIVLIIPCLLLSLLTLVSFWLPPETPAKILLGNVYLYSIYNYMHMHTYRSRGLRSSVSGIDYLLCNSYSTAKK